MSKDRQIIYYSMETTLKNEKQRENYYGFWIYIYFTMKTYFKYQSIGENWNSLYTFETFVKSIFRL